MSRSLLLMLLLLLLLLPKNRTLRPRREVQVQQYSFFNLGAKWEWVVNVMPGPF